MKARILSAALILALIFSLASLPFSPRAEALTISYAGAAPNMVSLFGDLTSSGTVPDSPLGPGWSTLAVRVASGPATSVKVNLRTFLESILPADMTPYVQDAAGWETWLHNQEAWNMTYNGGADLWTYNFSLNNFFQFIPSNLQAGKTLQVISEGLRLGSKTITATAQPGSVTSNITIYVVDAQTPLNAGWNLLSTPMALNSNTWSSIKALGGATSDIDATIRWDNSTQEWATVGDGTGGTTNYVLQPLEGIYVHSTAQRPLGAILSRTPSPSPTRTIRAGWNLVGSAPDLSLNSGYYKATTAGGSYRGLTKLTEFVATLVDTSTSPTTNYYSLAVTTGQERGFTTTNSHLGTTFTTYPWGYVQDPWTYIVGTHTVASINTTSPVPTSYFGWIVPFGGVWVYATSTRTLAGFSTTPVSASWLRTARTVVLGW